MGRLRVLAGAAAGYALGAILIGGVLAVFEMGGASLGPARGGLLVLGGVSAALIGAALSVRGPEGSLSRVHGTARFSQPHEDLASLSADRGVIVGRLSRERGLGPLLRYGGEAHLLTLAPTRSGKGVGAVIPNLLLLPRSILCIDPKGESVAVAAAARRRFGPVHILDPFAVTGEDASAFNPLSKLCAEDPDLPDRAAALAEAIAPEGGAGEAYWTEEARALLAGLILHVVTDPFETDKTLSRVRELVTRSGQAWLDVLEAMRLNSKAAEGLVARAASRQLSKSDREGPSVVSSAQRHTHFLDGGRMKATLSRSDFAFEDLAKETSTVFLVVPPERLATHGRWLRLLVVEALRALAAPGARGPNRPPTLFLLDEFAALGRLESVVQAFGLMAGYGVQLWPVLQDLGQLKSTYGRAAGTILANAGLLQIFNVAEVETAGFVSRTLGSATAEFTTRGASAAAGRRGGQTRSSHEQVTRRELLTPDEVMRLPRDRLLLLRPGERPSLARKVRYFEDPEFKGFFGPS